MCIVRGAPRAALSGPGERHRSPVRAGVRTLLRRREREKAQLALLQRKSTSPRKTLQPQPQTTLPPSVPTPSPPLRPAAAPPLGAAAAAGDESVRGISSLMRHARSRTRNILAAQDRQPVLSAAERRAAREKRRRAKRKRRNGAARRVQRRWRLARWRRARVEGASEIQRCCARRAHHARRTLAKARAAARVLQRARRDALARRVLRRSSVALQRQWRGARARQRRGEAHRAACDVQARWRASRERRARDARRQAAIALQAAHRRRAAQLEAARRARAATRQRCASRAIQARWRQRQARRERQSEATSTIARRWRGYCARERWQTLRCAALLLQHVHRRSARERALLRRRRRDEAARALQRAWRSCAARRERQRRAAALVLVLHYRFRRALRRRSAAIIVQCFMRMFWSVHAVCQRRGAVRAARCAAAAAATTVSRVQRGRSGRSAARRRVRAVVALQGAARTIVALRRARHCAAQARARRALGDCSRRAAQQLRQSRAAVNEALRAAAVSPPPAPNSAVRVLTVATSSDATFAQCADVTLTLLAVQLACSEEALVAMSLAEGAVQRALACRSSVEEEEEEDERFAWASAAIQRVKTRRNAEVARLQRDVPRTMRCVRACVKKLEKR